MRAFIHTYVRQQPNGIGEEYLTDQDLANGKRQRLMSANPSLIGKTG